MKIVDASLVMSSVGTQTQETREKESLEIIADPPDARDPVDRVSLSPGAKSCRSSRNDKTDRTEQIEKIAFAHELKALLVEVLSGKKVRLLDLSKLQETTNPKPDDAGTPPDEGSGIGIIYQKESFYRETENLSFASTGIVKTADGREIDFTLKLEMSREFVQYHNIDIRAGDPALTDPLVINAGGSAARLSDVRFAFDLNGDGTDDQMPGLAGGSGYLALDLNGDGRINDGRELFGPSTGNGFEELSKYDSDANDWIDEADPVYDRLRVWTVGENGAGRLESLSDTRVGAIHLGYVNTAFNLKDPDNTLEGKVVNTGLFLKEDGTAGTVQQLDLVV